MCVQRARCTRTCTCTCGVACTQCLHEEYIDVAVRALEDLEGVRVLLAVERVAPATARDDVIRATTMLQLCGAELAVGRGVGVAGPAGGFRPDGVDRMNASLDQVIQGLARPAQLLRSELLMEECFDETDEICGGKTHGLRFLLVPVDDEPRRWLRLGLCCSSGSRFSC